MSDPARTDLRGNNLDLVRQRNLSLVLGRVHTLGSVPRAQLTRETGLNRSTIGALVAELVSLGLVRETNPAPASQVGRPSMVIVPTDRAVVITVHPELDGVAVDLVGLGGRVLSSVRHDSMRIPTVAEVVSIAAREIAGMRAAFDSDRLVVGIGLAVPGLVRATDGVVTLAPHLAWRDEPLGAELHAATGLEVFAANDASLGAMAESTRGAGRGVANLVYLNGGASGIGGGIIAGGVLLGGASGFAGEIGHTLVNSNGVACHCGSTGCLETEVAREPLLDALGLAPTEFAQLEARLVERFAAMPGADDPVIHLVHRQVSFLARAIANTVNIFNPQLVVLGGFLGALLEVAPQLLESEVARTAMAGPRETVRIVRPELGSSILAVGAAELAFRPLIEHPAERAEPVAADGAVTRDELEAAEW